MYQSLYRKYRPSTFDEVIGQKVIVTTLKNAIANNKISHAYLFAGPRGTGKTSIAKILAKTINCENLNNIIPCNKCVSCTQINNKQSIDILEIDAASNNGVDEIRELNSKVNLVPSVGTYKVYIIDEVHMLTVGAFNALLKTLEEPPAHIIFILATTEPYKIPSTILSRCQRYDFKKLTNLEIEQRLNEIVKKENINITAEAITEIAKLSDGGMRDSLSMLDQVIAYATNDIKIEDVHEVNGTITKEELSKLIQLLLKKDLESILYKIDSYDEKGKDFTKLAEEIILFLKNILLFKTVPQYFKENNQNIEIYENLVEFISNELLIEYIKEFNNLILEMKTSNNPKLNFELIFIKLTNVDKIDNNKVEETKTPIIQPIKSIQKKQINNNTTEDNYIVDEQLEKIKKIRINNTLCSLDKNKMKEINNNIRTLMPMMINEDYGDIYSLLLDGELKAFGNNIIIYIYKTKRISDEFNFKLKLIEKMIQEKLQKEYKVISTYQEDWNKIKDEFNKKQKKYEYIEEPEYIEDTVNENDIEELFDQIVEYN